MSRRKNRIGRACLEALESRVLQANILVSSTEDNNFSGRLRSAIDAAAPGDTLDLRFLTGSIDLSLGQLTIDKDLTIVGPGASTLTINGNGTQRLFDLSAGHSLKIVGLTLSGGYASDMGGGGAIYSEGNLTLDRVTVSGNVGFMRGGAIDQMGGTLAVTNSTFTQNGCYDNSTIDVMRGGALYAENATTTISGSTFYNNLIDGGLTDATSYRITYGGAASFMSGTTTLLNCTIVGNQTKGSHGSTRSSGSLGGGIATTNSADFRMINCTVGGNMALMGDGSSGTDGGGIAIQTPTAVKLINNLIANNQATDSQQVLTAWAFGTATVTSGGNLIGINDGTIAGISNGVNGNQVYIPGAFVSAADLQLNGGPTWTVKPTTPYLVLNKGVFDPELTLFDQRGMPRYGLPDIGAYEEQGAPTTGEWRNLQFDGVDDTVVIPNIPALATAQNSQQYTLEAWINLDADATGTNMIFWYGEPAQAAFGLAYDADFQAFVFRAGGSSTTIAASVPKASISGRWASIAVRYSQSGGIYNNNGSTLAQLFLDGTMIGQVNGVGNTPFNPLSQGYIGSHGGDSLFFKGSIDRVRLSNAFLNASDFASQDLPTTPNTHVIGDWHLDELTGPWAFDSSPSGARGTLVGFDTSATRPMSTAPVQLSLDEDSYTYAILPAYAMGPYALHFEVVTQPTKGLVSIYNDAAGQIIYAPNANAYGADSFTYRVYNSWTDLWSSPATVNVNIAPLPDPPSFTSNPSSDPADSQANYSYTIQTTDPDGDALTISAPTLPSWLAFTDNGDGTATLTGKPGVFHLGANPVVLKVTDGSTTVTQSFSIFVTYTNHPPTLNLPEAVDADAGSPFHYVVTTSDADGDPIEFTVLEKPDWMTVTDNHDGTATLGGTPPYVHGFVISTLHLQINDGYVNNDGWMNISAYGANHFPTMTLSTTSAIVGQPFDATVTFDDPEGDTASISSEPGSFVTNGWLSYQYDQDGVLHLIGTPQQLGDSDHTISITDGYNTEALNFTIHVTLPPNATPVFTTLAPAGTVAGSLYTYNIATTDADGDPLTIFATLLPNWLTLTDHHDGTATLSGTSTNANVGLHVNPVVLKVTDGRTTKSQAFEINVSSVNHAPVFTTTPWGKGSYFIAGNEYSLRFMASDPDGEDVSINPMTIPSWLHVELSAPGLLEVRGTPGPLDGGDAAAVFSIRATDGKSFTEQNFTLPVGVRAASLNSAGTLTVNGDANDNAIHVWVRNGNTVRVDRDGTIKDFDLASVKNVEVYGVDGNDNILLNLGAIPAYALGGAGNDTLTGGDEYDNFVGGGGKDNLSGGLGDDRLDGGNANDTLAGNDGDDRIYGGDGNDILVGGNGKDRCYGEAGDDFFISRGDKKVDNLYGGGGDDRATYDELLDHLTDVLPA